MSLLKIAGLAPALLVALLNHAAHDQRHVLESDSLAFVALNQLVVLHATVAQLRLAVRSQYVAPLLFNRVVALNHAVVVAHAIPAVEVDDSIVCSHDCQRDACSQGCKPATCFRASLVCVDVGRKENTIRNSNCKRQ